MSGAVGEACGNVRCESRHGAVYTRPIRAAVGGTLDDVIRDWGAAVTHWRSPRERGSCVAGRWGQQRWRSGSHCRNTLRCIGSSSAGRQAKRATAIDRHGV